MPGRRIEAGRVDGVSANAGRGAKAINCSVDDADRARRFRDAALPHLDDAYTLARYLLRDASDAEDAVRKDLTSNVMPGFRFKTLLEMRGQTRYSSGADNQRK